MANIDQRDKWIVFWDKIGSKSYIKPPFFSLSFLYGIGVFFRKKAYTKGLISVKRLPCPVFSIGNLTVGGTGKTPVTGMIAKFLLDYGCHPAILTRGYKRQGKKNLTVVSDAERILMTPKEVGDEPYMLACWLPGVPIIVGKDRFTSGIFAIKKFKADCFILDDGFQHLRLFRDRDILVINAGDPFGNSKLLPYGRLREPLSSINRASLILLNKVIPGQDLDNIFNVLRKYNTQAPIIETIYKPIHLVSALNSESHMPLSNLNGKNILTFTGIADPYPFLELLKKTGAKIVNSFIFSDHHWFSEKDLDRIRRTANSSFVDYIVTTEKDGVRLPPDNNRDGIYILKMKMGLNESQKILENILCPILVQ